MSLISVDNAATSSQMLVGSDMIGRTYNVKTGMIANTMSLLPYQLFEISDSGNSTVSIYNIEYAVPSCLVCSPINETTVNTSQSETHTATETEENFGVELGVSGVSGTFSGELNASYAKQSSTLVSSSYYTSTLRSQVRSYRLELEPADYRSLLKSDVANDIDTMDAAELVAKYGTHFLRSAVFGGSWDFSQSITTAAAASKEAAQEEVSANYNSVSTTITHSNQTIEMQSSTQTDAVFTAIGGDTSSVSGDIETWAATVPGNFAMISFDSNQGSFASLQPLSVLATTEERAEEIDQAIIDYLQQQFSLYDVVWDMSQVEYWFCDYHGSKNQLEQPGVGEKSVEIKDNVQQIIVGIGMSIEDNDVSSLGIKVLDLTTSQTSWIDADNRAIAGDPGSYEKIVDLTNLAPNSGGTIRQLYVAVGVSGSAEENECSGLGLFYQTLNFTDDQTKFLEGSINHDYVGGSDVAYKPDAGAQTILLGVSARAQDGILKNLYLKTAPLKQIVQ